VGLRGGTTLLVNFKKQTSNADAGATAATEHELEELFQRYAPGLGSYFLARFRDAELAEELTARVFVLAVQNFEQCRGNRPGWLWAIAQSVLSRHVRERGRGRVLPPPLSIPQCDPGDAAEARELQARLPELLADLSEQQHELIYLKYFQDLSNSEIAETTGLTATNVAVVLHRTLKRLRELIEEPAAREKRIWPKPNQTLV
jgi:RNA polymerase sigma factor (sigma-70 family)